MATIKTFEELYEIGKNEMQGRDPTLTDFTEGSINDAYVGTTAVLVQEAFRIIVDQYKKTYIGSAEGTDLDFLITDHYGPDFARPEATKAVGIAVFSRPTSGAGDVSIAAGTIIKTPPDANGNVKSFETISAGLMTGLSLNLSIRALTAGVQGNADAATITVIETTLTDPTVVVTNTDATSGGSERDTDPEYREFTYAKLLSLAGATLQSIEAAAKTVSGIEYATGKEFIKTVIEYDESDASTIGEAFKIVLARLYVADANGVANDALIDLVEEAIEPFVALGVNVQVLSAIATSINWAATITLDPSGPNFAELSVDPQPIVDDMVEYIQNLPIGQNFVVATAEAAILAIWGPAGSEDITAFSTSVPSGNLASDANEKFIAGTVELV